eukprot:TRINITY_DN94318_c0_g1_i1.p1 TRINITY_DN94318_c0_g1~~TRINITY_DN94318_c0_g1_i1.p1  ORF type:complete len:787 (-),score=127.85 TRINITY_DN94318_c0_g1_i1:188-2305(-)
MIVIYALMMLVHIDPSKIYGLEDALQTDLVENANFAFSAPGYMGHKNYQDVHSYSDFYSWLNDGFAAVYLPIESAVSEDSTLAPTQLKWEQAARWLIHNRKVGMVRLSQQTAAEIPCPNPSMAEKFKLTCREEGGMNLDVEPTTFGVLNWHMIEDPRKTLWVSIGNESHQRVFRDLEAKEWLDAKTRHVKVSFLSYHADYDLLTVTNVNFMFSRTGRAWKDVCFQTAFLYPYSDMTILAWEILFFGCVTFIFLSETIDVLMGLKRSKCKFRAFLSDYLSFWNFVDWVSVLAGFVIMGMWIRQCIQSAKIQKSLEQFAERGVCTGDSPTFEYDECVKASANLHADADVLSQQLRYSNIFMGIYPLCIMLRLFKAFSHQPRLAVVTNSLSASAGDLSHFCIVFLSIFSSYAFMAIAIFGQDVQEFATFSIACMTLFRICMGDFDIHELEMKAGRLISAIFFVSFMLISTMLLLNMLIAIIMDVYSQQKEAADSSSTVYHDMWELCRRSYQNRKKQRMPLPLAYKLYLDAVSDAETSDRIVFMDEFREKIPGIAEKQVRRAFTRAVERLAEKNKIVVDSSELMTTIMNMENRTMSVLKTVSGNNVLSPLFKQSHQHQTFQRPKLDDESEGMLPDVSQEDGEGKGDGAENYDDSVGEIRRALQDTAKRVASSSSLPKAQADLLLKLLSSADDVCSIVPGANGSVRSHSL